MATIAPTLTWSYGKVINITDSSVTDDTEQWSYGQVLSVLEYVSAIPSGSPNYDITANETITITIPATALTAAAEIVCDSFVITADGASTGSDLLFLLKYLRR